MKLLQRLLNWFDQFPPEDIDPRDPSEGDMLDDFDWYGSTKPAERAS